MRIEFLPTASITVLDLDQKIKTANRHKIQNICLSVLAHTALVLSTFKAATIILRNFSMSSPYLLIGGALLTQVLYQKYLAPLTHKIHLNGKESRLLNDLKFYGLQPKQRKGEDLSELDVASMSVFLIHRLMHYVSTFNHPYRSTTENREYMQKKLNSTLVPIAAHLIYLHLLNLGEEERILHFCETPPVLLTKEIAENLEEHRLYFLKQPLYLYGHPEAIAKEYQKAFILVHNGEIFEFPLCINDLKTESSIQSMLNKFRVSYETFCRDH
ncbi:MAG: hypothetical protein ACOYL1_04860 [Chlamydiia bacterium]